MFDMITGMFEVEVDIDRSSDRFFLDFSTASLN